MSTPTAPCRRFNIQYRADAAHNDFLALLEARKNGGDKPAQAQEEAVAAMLDAVRRDGLAAVVDYTRQYDCPHFGPELFQTPASALEQAAKALPAADLAVIREAIAHVHEFHSRQAEKSWFMTRPDGTLLGQQLTPVDRAGLYVPGGRSGETPLISSLIMNAVPARIAGVPELAVISPPRKDGSISPYILATAHLLGITELYAAGGAWGIGALAFGAGPLRPVDLICGPGNIWVSTAKRLLIGQVGIDMIAGPSEILILADASANPAWVAADLLSQAEHDPLACAVCISASAELLDAVAIELARQVELLPRAEIARAALRDWGALVQVPQESQAATDGQAPEEPLAFELSNRMAPEHLELLFDDPWRIMPRIRHAGAVFMGHYSAEPLGDYFAGPNHVLPTLGTARFSSALGVQTFCKKTSIIAASQAFAQDAARAIGRLARLEGLEAHARSAELRGAEK